jgi:hypothetical protein
MNQPYPLNLMNNGLSFSFRRMVGAVLLCVATAAGAQTASGDALHGLAGGPAFRTFVRDGLILRASAFEMTLRILTLNRCSAVKEMQDAGFPAHPAPRVAAVVDAGWHWLLQGGIDSSPDPVLSRARQQEIELLTALLHQAFSSDELRQWDQFRASPRGARGIAVNGLLQGLSVFVKESLWSDPTTGRNVGWPLATLGHMADDLHLRSEFDAAFDELSPGASLEVRKFSEVMGEGEQGGHFDVNTVYSDELVSAFRKHLSQGDQAALQAWEDHPVVQRWAQIMVNYQDFRGIMGNMELAFRIGHPSASKPEPPSVQEFCKAAELHCTPSLMDALELRRKDFLEAALKFSYAPEGMKQLIKQLPEAGCPQP